VHRPTQRRDALRERVVAGRQQRAARLRRAAAARKGGRRMVALFAGLAMVAGVLTVTQLASSALEEENSGLGACETTAPAEESEAGEEAGVGEAAEDADAAAPVEAEVVPPENPVEDPAADGVTSTDELEAHIEVEADGFRHTHYRRPGWRPGGGHGHHRPRPRPTTPPAEETTPPAECEEPTEDPTSDPTGDPTGEPTEEPTGDPTGEPTGDPTEEPTEEPTETPSPEPTDPTENPDLFVGNTCDAVGGGLANHTGFQSNDAQCVTAQHGVVAQVQNSPALTIADAPETVGVNQPFSIFVSTRNLVRDFFPPAGQGGYYLNSAFLNEEGLQRGHFHTACNLQPDRSVPLTPDELLNPQFFVATEDAGGGREPDTVEVVVTAGLPTPGTYRCSSWAGDASHRIPMLNFARQTPAFDVVRIEVTG
jgi:PT repeat